MIPDVDGTLQKDASVTASAADTPDAQDASVMTIRRLCSKLGFVPELSQDRIRVSTKTDLCSLLQGAFSNT